MIVFQFFSLAILSLLVENSFEFRFSPLRMSQTQSMPLSFLVPSVTFLVIVSVPDLGRCYWPLSSGANWSGSAYGLLRDLNFNVFLFLNLSIFLVGGLLRIADLSLLFILFVIHPFGN
jgi:hypothetical protein